MAGLLIETPGGRIPLSRLASIEDADGPNQITRDEGRRRIVISANVQGRALSAVVADLRQAVAEFPLPEGYFITLGGQFQAQEEAARLIAVLALVGIAALALGGMVIDMAASWLGAKWSGASKAGLWGAIIGSICGLPLGLVGLVLGPFVGAVIGELLANQGVWRAGKIGLATLLGLAIGTAGKLGAVLAMLAVFALAWWY